jgi:hypothetical protein
MFIVTDEVRFKRGSHLTLLDSLLWISYSATTYLLDGTLISMLVESFLSTPIKHHVCKSHFCWNIYP